MRQYLVFVALLVVGAWVCAQSGTVFATAGAQDAPVRLSGEFSVLWSDPLPDTGLRPRVQYFLDDDRVGRVELLIDDAVTGALGGVYPFHRRRVVATGVPLVAPASAAAPSIRISSLALESLPPTGAAAPESVTPSGDQPWVTVLCKYQDVATEPAKFDYFQMYANTRPYLDHYWRELSYGLMNVSGSTTVGWFTLPHPRSYYYQAGSGDLNTGLMTTDCAGAADPFVNFSIYAGVNMMLNGPIDAAGAWAGLGGGTTLQFDGVSRVYGATWIANTGDLAVVAHEMGHALGLPHSSGNYGVVYDNPWDLMSHQTQQHSIAFHKDLLGWQTGRRFDVQPGTSATVWIDALASPSAGWQYMRVPIPGTQRFYTVEARVRVGYDGSLPGDAVIIHEVDPARSEPAHVIDADGNGDNSDAGARWTPGETFVDSANGISIAVNGATGSSFNVTVASLYADLPGNFNKAGPASGVVVQSLNPMLTWGASTDAWSYEYCIDRSSNSTCDGSWISTGTATSVALGALIPGATYFWQVRARSAAGTTDADGGAWWSLATLPARVYFLDDMEGGAGNWLPQPPWALTAESAHTGTHAWSDSPGADYAPGVNASLRTRAIDLSAASAPQLTFWHRRDLASDGVDYGGVWAVSDGGTFTVLQTFRGASPAWGKSTVDLSAYAGMTSVRLYFQMSANSSLSGDGWYIDDVMVGEASAAQNGGFGSGLSNWQEYATPDLSYIVSQVTDGVLEFYRVAPPPGQSNQAVVLQNTGLPLAAGAALAAQFDLGNSSSVRKRISVLIHDGDFSDLSVCTFWLAPNTPLRTYSMQTHSTKDWTNASISFYAATPGSDGGFYRVDNVVVQYAPTQAIDRTDCVDPTAPVPPGGTDGPELLTHGDFGAGTTAGWSLYGQLLQQVNGGVFEFYRPAAAPDPAGVILQPTGQSLGAGEILTAQFDLGNSSAVRKRVTVLLHDLDFSDLSACTFWLAPGQPLSSYAMRSFATKAWTDATISIYAATVGDETWTRLDNVSLRKTPGAATIGTDCVEPGGAPPGATPSLAVPADPIPLASPQEPLLPLVPAPVFVAGPAAVIVEPTIPVTLGGPAGNNLSLVAKTLAADLAGRGRADVVIGVGLNPLIPPVKMPMRVLRPGVGGSLADVTRQLFGTGALPSAGAPGQLLAADFNRDGRLDLFVPDAGYDGSPPDGATNLLLHSTSAGTFVDRSDTLPSVPDYTHGAAVSDVNGDGFLDVYVGNIYGSFNVGPYFLMGKADGTFNQVTTTLPAAIRSLAEKFTAACLLDVDNDGFPDLILGTHHDNGYVDSIVLFNDGTGDFTSRPRYVLPTGPLGTNFFAIAIQTIDANHDGYMDLLLLGHQYQPNYVGGSIQLLINQKNGTFADETLARLGPRATVLTGIGWDSLQVVDMNGDGALDILASAEFGFPGMNTADYLWVNNTDGTFSPMSAATLSPAPIGKLIATDADGDGQVDLVAVQFTSDGYLQYQTYLNRTPPGAFSKSTPVNGAVGQPTSVTVSWTSSSGTTSYESCYDTTNDDSCSNWTPVGNVLSAVLTGLSPGTSYYWQVRATNASGTPTYADASGATFWSFTTQATLVQNGSFDGGTSGWQQYATPNLSYIVSQVTNGVLEFYRLAPPPGQSNQAVVLQNTGLPLGAGEALDAQFDLGNSSSVRKRISVLIHDGDFSDLSVCTFWLAPNAPLATYGMRTHSTTAWTNATISFYAATAGSDGGFYRLDNVVVQYAPSQATDRTDCIDPTVPTPSGVADGPELLTNGTFGTGTTTGWSLYGQLLQQVSGGVFEFYRPAAAPDPAGVILQPTGQPLAAGEILTAQFDLGNSSAVRKRVTVLLHDLDFSDLSACTFWLAPGQALSTYAMRSFATQAWTNTTISIYAATVGDDTWTRLDNVSLRKTPGAATTGTDCVEPGGSLAASAPSAVVPVGASTSATTGVASLGTGPMDAIAPDWRATAGFALTANASVSGPGPAWIAVATETRRELLSWAKPIDLREVTNARLQFRSWLLSRTSTAAVQVSTDGLSWQTLTSVPATGDWALVDIDFSAYAGQLVWLRFVFDAIAPATPADPLDSWWIDHVEVQTPRPVPMPTPPKGAKALGSLVIRIPFGGPCSW